MPIIWLLVLIFLTQPGQAGSGPAAPSPGESLESLHYRVSLGIWSEVAEVNLRLSRMAPNRYRAEFRGAAEGAWALLSRWLPEGYETEMVLEGGRLKPQVYRETFKSKGRRILKEYRFDYARGLLEVWRGQDYQEPEKRSEIPLREPVYDLLSLFYNLRLGAIGPWAGGQTMRVALIPAPEPRELVVRTGSEGYEGRKIMLEVTGQKEEDEAGTYFLLITSQWVPREAWTRVPLFGKLSGRLLNPEAILPDLSPALRKGNIP